MERKIRVGAVSYLNTKPLIYGFKQGIMSDQLDLIIDYPSRVANMLIDNQIDIGLVPVAIIPKLLTYHIISDYCIGATGKVKSVCLFSNVPLTEIRKILLDYQSRSSVALLKILLKEFYTIEPELEDASPGYIENIKGTTAGLIIGDRALIHESEFKYVFDLAEGWQQLTNLPFLFAAWISNHELPASFIEGFNLANKYGCDHLQEVIKINECNNIDLFTYYTKNISYNRDEYKMKGMNLFIDKVKMLA